MEETIGIIIGFVCCFTIIIALVVAVCCYEAENSRLRKENRRLRRTLRDYCRLEQASLDAHAALFWETQRCLEVWSRH